MRINQVLPFLVPLLCAAVIAGAAEERIVVADFSSWIAAKGLPGGWELKVKSGKASYEVKRDGDIPALHLKSVDSSFSLQSEVQVDLKQHPLLSWKWKAVKLPAGGDFRRSSTDDQAAQLFLVFSKTESIVYIWDTTAPQGLTEDTKPVPFMHVHVVVVRSGPAELGKWVAETRNVYEDYRKLYGKEPPAVKGVRLQINSQHTGTSAESMFADVAFTKQ